MLHELSGSEGNVIGLQAEGPLTFADYQKWVPEMRARADAHGGKLRVLIEMAGFEGWESAAAVWEELKADALLIGSIERLAVIAYSLPERVVADASALFLPGRVRVFDAEAISDAWAWLKSDTA